MFKHILIVLTMVSVLSSCNAGRKRQGRTETPPEPVRYTYRIINSYPHSTQSYTQGLEYVDGTMWEGTGLNGKSFLQTISLEDGTVTHLNKLPDHEFGEGITILGRKIYQLTWQSRLVHIYDKKSCKLLRNAAYNGEGWGLANDGEKIYMSDGSGSIRIIEGDTFRQKGSIDVTLNGRSVEWINELEWIEGKLWANVYTSSCILIINPENGQVEGLVNLEGILSEEETDERTDVLNGIAYDKASKRIFVTGKNWPKIFEIELIQL